MLSASGHIIPRKWWHDPAFAKLRKLMPTTWQYRTAASNADASGITDPDVLDAVAFYRHSAWRHESATNRLDFCSFGLLLGFDALQVVPELLTQPLLVIANGRDGSTGAQGDSQSLFDLAASDDKRIVSVEGAGHYEMYHVPAYVDQAVSELTTFFQTRLID